MAHEEDQDFYEEKEEFVALNTHGNLRGTNLLENGFLKEKTSHVGNTIHVDAKGHVEKRVHVSLMVPAVKNTAGKLIINPLCDYILSLMLVVFLFLFEDSN